MNANRKLWNEHHQELTRTLAIGDRDRAVELFLAQHAVVHAAEMSASQLWSFEDEILADMNVEEIRQIPAGGEHSIAWILFHLARIEDITMNLLVARTPQLFRRDGWAEPLNVSILHSANRMDDQSLHELSRTIDIHSLRH